MNRTFSSLITIAVILVGTSIIEKSYHPRSGASSKVAVVFPGQSTDRSVLALDPKKQRQLLALLNRGSAADLESIKGVSDGRISSIEVARPFLKPEQVMNVHGVGERTFRNIVAHVDAQF